MAARERLLDPIARMSEVLFGLIMVLTFTGTLDVASAGNEDVRMLLIGTIGCNLAWGLVDAVMFLISTLTERGRNLVTVREVQAAATPEHAHQIISDALPPVVASIMKPHEIELLRQGLAAMPGLPARPSLEREDWLRAAAIFLLVFLSTFPVVIPFMIFNEVQVAMRASNLVAISLLFLVGFVLARYGGYRPVLTGASMVLLGVALVAIAIALGG
jgi:VIT1/CCC1 family predicted Fe2+/Mn2+ transporter